MAAMPRLLSLGRRWSTGAIGHDQPVSDVAQGSRKQTAEANGRWRHSPRRPRHFVPAAYRAYADTLSSAWMESMSSTTFMCRSEGHQRIELTRLRSCSASRFPVGIITLERKWLDVAITDESPGDARVSPARQRPGHAPGAIARRCIRCDDRNALRLVMGRSDCPGFTISRTFRQRRPAGGIRPGQRRFG